MTFISPAFVAFLAVVYGLYWLLERRHQNLLILASSLFFYGWWDWRFLGMLLFIAGIDYAAALGMQANADPQRRRLLLALSLASNLGALGYFKYCNFFLSSLHSGLDLLGIHTAAPTLRVILPIGISFYTFQALSYTIDVYRGRLAPVRSIVEYFSFITFFPHMVAGPIQQASHLLVQFHRDRVFSWDRSVDGLRQMLWGYFKKMIADLLAPVVAASFTHPQWHSGDSLLWASYLFAFQIYCDFSGYTDIAIGCARLFDLNMTRNFAYPYFAVNIKDFWRRWHISLSTWFREYVYIPLGGNRLGSSRAALNAFIVFVVSGIWHGANWTFALWGALHGAYYYLYTRCFERSGTAPAPEKGGLLPKPTTLLSMFITFNLVCVAWVFFRAEHTSDAFIILRKIASAAVHREIGRPPLVPFLWVAALVGMEWVQRHHAHPLVLDHWPRPARWGAYYALVLALLLFMPIHYTPFIYFQF